MAPMTRNHMLAPHQGAREGSYFSDAASDRDREASTDPSYEEEEPEGDVEAYSQEPSIDMNAGDLHPLAETADRVGREVEAFAVALDEFNSHRAASKNEKHELSLLLIDRCHNIAQETVERLRETHAEDLRKKGLQAKRQLRGFDIDDDEEDMEVEVAEEDGFPEPQTTLDDLERWQGELHTWDLMRRLVHLRFPLADSQENGNKSLSDESPLHKYATESEVWDGFLKSDSLALERKDVLQWLKDTAEETRPDIDEIVQDLHHKADRDHSITHGWLYTKNEIKRQKREHGWGHVLDPNAGEIRANILDTSGTDYLVTQLDPDVITRQRRKLEESDEYIERAIWLGCYEMLRRGRSLGDIKEWCSDHDEAWRAIAMSGLPDDRNEDEEAVDAMSSPLWRRMCYSLAQNGSGDVYEKAVYGILSGDIDSVLPVCYSWDDVLFAHYNALLRTQFDNYLIKLQPTSMSTLASFGISDAVQFHGEAKSAGQRIIEKLKQDPALQEESLEPMKMIQGVLIADRFQHFIYHQGLALSNFANAERPSTIIPLTLERPEEEDMTQYIKKHDHDGLRVLTHLLLVFIGLGLDFGRERQTVIENVIVAYVGFLQEAGKEELIPLYCSQLSGNRRYATLCRTLVDVTDNKQRAYQISLMRGLGLDVQQFVRFQARYMFSDYPDTENDYPATKDFKLLNDVGNSRELRQDFLGPDDAVLRKEDELFIRCLEWYLLVDGLWSETFKIGTMLYLRFFKYLHLDAARALGDRVPSVSICSAKTKAILGQSMDWIALDPENQGQEDWMESDAATAEQNLLLRKHLLAESSTFRELETLLFALDYTETIAAVVPIIREGYETPAGARDAKKKLTGIVSRYTESMQPLLQGWLLKTQQKDEQYALLRKAYLPETILAYVYALIHSGSLLTRDRLMECMELSSVIAAKDSDVLDLFVQTGRMKELVDAFALASKNLAIQTQHAGSSRTSKKLRHAGWTQELWTLKHT